MSNDNKENENTKPPDVSAYIDKVKISTESTESGLRWAAAVWKEKSQVRKLIFLAIAIVTIFFSLWSFQTQLFGENILPKWLSYAVAVIVVALLIIAFILILREKTEGGTTMRIRSKAIRGLLSFNFSREDALVFADLQRADKIRQCTLAITDPKYRFFILSGKSGCGKSSLLQAGIRPKLESDEPKHQTIYLKLTNEDPFRTLRREIARVCEVELESLKNADLTTLFDLPAKENKPTVLIFDQFEQFFVYQKDKEKRKRFATQLAKWYQQTDSKSVKVLFSIRDDFRSDIDADFQEKMDYALNQYQNFTLQKFDADEATEVFRVMADEINLVCDDSFIKDLCRKQLAGKDDGLISPVDVQVLAEMMIKVNLNEAAFNEKAFQKVGGVEGLMEQFLVTNLNDLSPDKENPLRQAAVKVLLALTDLERNTRAGILTVDEIKEKLGDTVSPPEVERAIKWLDELRLITSAEKENQDGFELSHERLITGLRRLVDKELPPTRQADLLLERRTNEWIGNSRNSRYLLSWSELSQIKKHEKLLQWGENKNLKEDFINTSLHSLRNRAAIYATPLVLLVAVIVGYQTYKYWLCCTEAGKQYQTELRLQQIEKDLRESIKETSDETLAAMAVSDASRDKNQLAEESLDRIKDNQKKIQGLVTVSRILKKKGNAEKAGSLLDKARKILDEEADVTKKVHGLSWLAGELETNELRERIRSISTGTSVNEEENSITKNENFTPIAIELGLKGQKELGIDLLKQSIRDGLRNTDYFGIYPQLLQNKKGGGAFAKEEYLNVANSLEGNNYKRNFLLSAAKVKQLNGNLDEAIDLAKESLRWNINLSEDRFRKYPPGSEEIKGLMYAAQIIGESGNRSESFAYFDAALTKHREVGRSFASIPDPTPNSRPTPGNETKLWWQSVGLEIIKNMAEVGEEKEDVEYINQALRLVGDNPHSKKELAVHIAKAMAFVATTKNDLLLRDKSLLDRAITLAEEKEETLGYFTRIDLANFAAVLAANGEKEKAKQLFKQALALSPQEESLFDNFFTYTKNSIEKASIKSNDDFLLQELISVVGNKDDRTKSQVFYTASLIYAKMGRLDDAFNHAKAIENETEEEKTLADVLRVWRNPDLAKLEEELKEEEPRLSFDSFTLFN
ncbi:MAG TPA: ATP-binding protein [Pyrinomonadaceae bacterium]|jgi:tetratricopeptide (TPR) repeat protein